MSSTYSSDLRIELLGTGDQAGTWGTTTNTNLGSLIEQSIAGNPTVSVTASPRALTALNGAVDESRQATLTLTTTLTTAFTVYAPPVPKQYVIYNNTAYTATIGNATAINGTTPTGGTTIAIPAGKTVTVFSDGTNIASSNTHLPGVPTAATAASGTNTTQVATTAFVQGEKASPVFTGVPTAPTAAFGTSTTQIATTAFATTALALKADLASPTFTGTPTLPTGTVGTTQSAGNNTTALATTAFATTADNLKANLSGAAFSGAISATNLSGTNTGDGVGQGQTWQDMSGSRSYGTTYTNSTGRPISLNLNISNTASPGGGASISINGATAFVFAYASAQTLPVQGVGSCLIPVGATYLLAATGTGSSVITWFELR